MGVILRALAVAARGAVVAVARALRAGMSVTAAVLRHGAARAAGALSRGAGALRRGASATGRVAGRAAERAGDLASALFSRLERSEGWAVEVGVIGREAGARPDGEATNAVIGAAHEFGVPGRVPERSFLRATVTQNRPEIGRLFARAFSEHIRGRPLQSALDTVGAQVVRMIHERMAEGVPPPLSPATVARKGSSKPLIDTGQLRQSITHRVVRSR